MSTGTFLDSLVNPQDQGKMGLNANNIEDVHSPGLPQQNATPEQEAYQQHSSFYKQAAELPLPKQKETFKEKVRRGSGRTLARGIEALAGLPGDIRDFAFSLVGKGAEKIGIPSPPEEVMKLAQLAMGPLGQVPSSQEIRESVTQGLTGDYLEPRSGGEELYDEIVGDAATLMLPIKGKIPFARALGLSIGSNLGKESLKTMGATENQAQLGKLGMMFLLGSVGRGSARKYANNLFREAIESIPEDARVGGKGFITQVDKFITNLEKGGMSPQKTPAYRLAKNLQEKLRKGGGEIPADELPAFRKSINDFRFNREAGLTDQGRFYLDRFDDVLNKELLEYGKQNPAFLKQYRDANTAISGFKQSNKVARYISKNFDINGLKPETLVLLGLHLNNPSLLAKIGGGIGVAKSAQMIKRMTTNPVLRKHYENVIRDSLKENKAGMIRNLKLLNKELEKEDDIDLDES